MGDPYHIGADGTVSLFPVTRELELLSALYIATYPQVTHFLTI